jgi:hypothetical protein
MSQMNEESKESSNSSNQNLSIITSERIELLQREINVVRELLELEPDSKCLYNLEVIYIYNIHFNIIFLSYSIRLFTNLNKSSKRVKNKHERGFKEDR